MTIKKPRGRMPNEIKEWLAVNDQVPWQCCVCDCGHWFQWMDDLAPYHFENCRCYHCKKHVHEMIDDNQNTK